MNNFYIIAAAILLLSISSLFFKCSPSDRTTKNDRTVSTENQKSTVQNTEDQKKSEINTEQNTEKKEEIKDLFIKSGNEGYDSMPWDTEIQDFLIFYPTAEIIMNEDEFIGYRIEDETQNEKRLYYFFKNQLFRGITIYNDVYDQSKSEAITERLVELYGYPNDTKESTDLKKSKTLFGPTVYYKQSLLKAYWEKTPTFNIEYELEVLDGDRSEIVWYVTTSLSTVKITYSNPKKDEEIDKYLDKLDAAKRQAEKEKLNF